MGLKRKTPRGWIQIGESRTRGVARIPLRLKPSRDSRDTSQRDSPIWIQPLGGVFRYKSTAIRLWSCKRHPIAHPWGWGIGCPLWVLKYDQYSIFCLNLAVLNMILLKGVFCFCNSCISVCSSLWMINHTTQNVILDWYLWNIMYEWLTVITIHGLPHTIYAHGQWYQHHQVWDDQQYGFIVMCTVVGNTDSAVASKTQLASLMWPWASEDIRGVIWCKYLVLLMHDFFVVE